MDPRRGHRELRRLIDEGWRFAVVGLAGVIIVVVGADLLHYQVGLGRYAAISIAIIAGAIPNFAGNRCWTFRHRQRSGIGREAVRSSA
jgi:putative flippase GtrA